MTGTVTTAMPTSFKLELMTGLHNFTASTGHDFRVALIRGDGAYPTGSFGAATTNYSNLSTDEVPNGSGYTTGGFDITAANNTTPLTSGTTAYTTPGGSPSWTSATFTAVGCVIYNNTSGGRAAYVGSFGGAQTVTAGTFTLVWPSNSSSTGLLRLA